MERNIQLSCSYIRNMMNEKKLWEFHVYKEQFSFYWPRRPLQKAGISCTHWKPQKLQQENSGNNHSMSWAGSQHLGCDVWAAQKRSHLDYGNERWKSWGNCHEDKTSVQRLLQVSSMCCDGAVRCLRTWT